MKLLRFLGLAVGVSVGLLSVQVWAYDTSSHFDITRDAMAAEGFGNTAIQVAQVTGFFNDMYENGKSNPYSGHAGFLKELLLLAWGDREHWSDEIMDAAERMHFDELQNTVAIEAEWQRLARATRAAMLDRASAGDIVGVLTVLGISLHNVQDFYSHTNWVEPQGTSGQDPFSGPGWKDKGWGSHPTWFDIPEEVRRAEQIYTTKGPGQNRNHGHWQSDNNENLKTAINKDWPGRPLYQDAYISAYIASRQWIRAVRSWLANESVWQSAQQFNNRHGKQLNHDLRGAFAISFYSGHWQGNGEPAGADHPGPGGSLDDLRDVLDDYFDDEGWFEDRSSKTVFRRKWEELIVRMSPRASPPAAETPVASSRDIQEELEFVMVQVTRVKEIDDMDVGSIDQADWYSMSNIVGQEYISGLIHGYDSFDFLRKPYGPFTFIKALSKDAQFEEPVTTLQIEVKTADVRWAGTDDNVYLRINDRLRFNLDKPLYNDFERGDRDTYSLNPPAGLRVQDIEFIQIEKSPDGIAGGWRLGGIKVFVNRQLFYQNDNINRWLEDDKRTWRAPDFQPRQPVTEDVPITLRLFDDDDLFYGADDHADIHQDHDRFDLNLLYNRRTSAYRGDLSGVSTGTSRGGDQHGGRWPLVDGPQAEIDFRIQTLRITPPLLPAMTAEVQALEIMPGKDPVELNIPIAITTPAGKESKSTPFTFSQLQGTRVTFEAPRQVTVGSRILEFKNWDVNGQRADDPIVKVDLTQKVKLIVNYLALEKVSLSVRATAEGHTIPVPITVPMTVTTPTGKLPMQNTPFESYFDRGVRVSIEAPSDVSVPAGSLAFTRWELNDGSVVTTDQTATPVLAGNTVLIARYQPKPRLRLRVNAVGEGLPTGLTPLPLEIKLATSAGSESRRTPFEAFFAQGAQLTLEVSREVKIAGKTLIFVKWESDGGASSNQTTLSLRLEKEMLLIARYRVPEQPSTGPLIINVSASGKQVCGSSFSHELTVNWKVSGGKPPVQVRIEITGPDGETASIPFLPLEGTRTYQLEYPGGGSVKIKVTAKDASNSSSSAQSSVQLGKCQ